MIKDLENIVLSFLYFEKQIGYKKHRKYLHDLFGPFVCRRESEYDGNIICILRWKNKIKAAFRMNIGFTKPRNTYHITQLFELDQMNPTNCLRWYTRRGHKVSYFITDLQGLFGSRSFRTDACPVSGRRYKTPKYSCMWMRDRSCVPYKELIWPVYHHWRDYKFT